MKTFKKLFSVSAIVALLGTLMPIYAFGANYTTELVQAYDYAHDHGITTMSSIDNADMYGNLTRIAMAKMLANYAIDVLGLTPDTTKECTFPDVTAALDAQYDNWVTKACQLGLMGVGIKNFNPNGIVTRAEFGTAFSRALNANDADKLAEMNKADPYYKEHLNFLKEEGIMNNISDPNMVEVRGYVMLMMMRSDDTYTPTEGCSAEELLKCLTADDYDACVAACSGENPEEEDLPGYASVSTKAAAAQTVALNAVEKKIGTVTLKAGENDTTVTNIEITKSGLWQRADILNVQLMKNGEYVTDGKAFGSDNTAKLRFRPNLNLKANSSETFDVVVSLSWSNANGQHEFSVTAVTVANGTFSGTPAKLWSLTTTNYRVSPIVIDAFTAGWTYDAGEEDATIATIDLSSNVKATVSSITITSQEDELDKAFANAKAYIDDVEVWTVTVNDETITINGLDKEISKSDSFSVVVKADVIYVWDSTVKAFNLYIDDNHVNAIETNTNERMTSVKTATSPVSVKWVKLTMTKVIKDTQTVAPWTTAKLLSLNVTSAAELEVNNYYVEFPSTFPWANFEDEEVTLYVDGIDYTVTAAKLAANKFVLSNKNDKFSLSSNAGVNVVVEGKIKKNVADFTIAADSIKLWIVDIKNLENNKDILGLSETKWCHTTKVAAWTYTVTKPSTMPSNKTVMAGEPSDVLFFDLKATTENLVLKSVKVTADTEFKNFASSVSLMQWESIVKTFDDEDDLSGKNLTFDKLTKNLNKDSKVPFTIRVTAKDDSVTNLWASFKIDLTQLDTARSATPSVITSKTSWLIPGNTYQITSKNPTIKIVEKVWKNTTVNFKNNSAYDVKLKTIKFTITQNKVDGWYANFGGATLKLLDTIGWSIVATTSAWTSAVKRQWTHDATTEVTTAWTTAENAIRDAVNNAWSGDYTVSTVSTHKFTATQKFASDVALNDTITIAWKTLVCTTAWVAPWTAAIFTYDTTADYDNAVSTAWTEVKAAMTDAKYVYSFNDTTHKITATQKVAATLNGAQAINTRNFNESVTDWVTWVEWAMAWTISVPGKSTIDFAANGNTLSDDLSRVIEIVADANTITEDDYTITITELTYIYVDWTDESFPITETYDESK